MNSVFQKENKDFNKSKQIKFIYIKQLTDFDEIIPKVKFKMPNFLKKIIVCFKRCFSILTLRDNILILPINENYNISKFQWKILCKKVNEFILYNKIKNVALSSYLDNIFEFKSSVCDTNVQILNGRWVFPFLSFDVLKYITLKSKTELSQLEVAVLINDNTKLTNAIIMNLAKSVKLLTIVTANNKEIENIANYLYEDLGIVIRISNNKRKCLQRANIILNYDFDTQNINEYKINATSIIVNFKSKVDILSKSFNGINVNFFDFSPNNKFLTYFDEKKLSVCFPKQILLESLCIKSRSLEECNNIFKIYNINISALIGNNGIINKNEFITNFSIKAS